MSKERLDRASLFRTASLSVLGVAVSRHADSANAYRDDMASIFIRKAAL